MDVLVVAITWTKSCKTVRQGASFGVQGVSAVLLRDALKTSRILLILNIVQLIIEIMPATLETVDLLPNLTTVVQSILISRFLVNLRQSGGGPTAANNFARLRSLSRFSVPNFHIPTMEESVINPMGGPLEATDADQDGFGEVLDNDAVDEIEDSDPESSNADKSSPVAGPSRARRFVEASDLLSNHANQIGLNRHRADRQLPLAMSEHDDCQRLSDGLVYNAKILELALLPPLTCMFFVARLTPDGLLPLAFVCSRNEDLWHNSDNI
ncbi:hypothetical protein EIP86_010012 [Pleurotus ostreatoroseus]|nr:hypothetical protein EIP86_010012 [Pleurotus ostreatoroseus]